MHTFTLPSGPEIELREMTGAEEELLTNQRLIRKGESINQVLKNCILRIGENVEPSMQDALDMLSGDRLFVLVRLRQISLLPGSGKTVRFGYLDGHKEKRLAALKEPNITSAMLIRIVDIDGKPPSKKTLAEMSLRDRNALRKEMARVDAGIDTAVEVACEACGALQRTRLEAEPAFLFPSVRL